MQSLPRLSIRNKLSEVTGLGFQAAQHGMDNYTETGLAAMAGLGVLVGKKLLEVNTDSLVVNIAAKTAGTTAMVGVGLVAEHLLSRGFEQSTRLSRANTVS